MFNTFGRTEAEPHKTGVKPARACLFHTVVRWHELGEVENEYVLNNSIVFVNFTPKIIKVGPNLTKLWKNNFHCFWETWNRT